MKQLIISEQERIAICEAADILRRIWQGDIVGSGEPEVRAACQDLLAINYITPTWEDGQAS